MTENKIKDDNKGQKEVWTARKGETINIKLRKRRNMRKKIIHRNKF